MILWFTKQLLVIWISHLTLCYVNNNLAIYCTALHFNGMAIKALFISVLSGCVQRSTVNQLTNQSMFTMSFLFSWKGCSNISKNYLKIKEREREEAEERTAKRRSTYLSKYNGQHKYFHETLNYINMHRLVICSFGKKWYWSKRFIWKIKMQRTKNISRIKWYIALVLVSCCCLF